MAEEYIRYAVINATGSDTTIVEAVEGKRIVVVGYALVCSAATTARFESTAGGTALTGAMSFAENGGISVPTGEVPLMRTSVGEPLSLELSNGSAVVAGHLTYRVD